MGTPITGPRAQTVADTADPSDRSETGVEYQVKRAAFSLVGVLDAVTGGANSLANIVTIPAARALGSDFEFPTQNVVSKFLTDDPRHLRTARSGRLGTEIGALMIPGMIGVKTVTTAVRGSNVLRQATKATTATAAAGASAPSKQATLTRINELYRSVEATLASNPPRGAFSPYALDSLNDLARQYNTMTFDLWGDLTYSANMQGINKAFKALTAAVKAS